MPGQQVSLPPRDSVAPERAGRVLSANATSAPDSDWLLAALAALLADAPAATATGGTTADTAKPPTATDKPKADEDQPGLAGLSALVALLLSSHRTDGRTVTLESTAGNGLPAGGKLLPTISVAAARTAVTDSGEVDSTAARTAPGALSPALGTAVHNLLQQLAATQLATGELHHGVATAAASPSTSITGLLSNLAAGHLAPGLLPPSVASTVDSSALTAAPSLPHPADPGFGQAMANRVMWLAGQGVQHARIDVSPRELGPVIINLQLTSGGADVTLQAGQPQTRAALIAALPCLGELFAAAGLVLGDARVGDAAERRQSPVRARAAMLPAVDDGVDFAGWQQGMLDHFA